MIFWFLHFSFILMVFFAACSPAASETEAETDSETDGFFSEEDQEVQLSSEESPEDVFFVPLEASFMSEMGSFAYSFNYNGALLRLVDGPLEGSHGFGPQFQVEGGAEIIGTTLSVEDMDFTPELTPVSLKGQVEVYTTVHEEGDCRVTRGFSPHLKEALVLELRICLGDQASYGEEAFTSLFEGLTMKSL